MSRFEEIQKKLEELSPIPVNMPKLYLLGDTGAGKTTIVRKILGTEDFKFPSALQKRTTVAVTEYILSRDLPYKATYIFKNEKHIGQLINEILEISLENGYISYRKNVLDIENIAQDLEETPDERFRLKYILAKDELLEVANEIAKLLPLFHISVEKLKADFESNDQDLNELIELTLEQYNHELSVINNILIGKIKEKVSYLCNGFQLFSDVDYFQHSSDNLDSFIDQAKKLLSSTKNSISPIVEYARLQGNILAKWLPNDAELVLIDGEGIGHDAREASSRLSARHLDYFHFADSIALVEECKKPFTSGGKSALDGIIRNGYLNKFNLIFSKLDEVKVDEDEDAGRADQVKAVNKGLTNVKNALLEDGSELNLENDRIFYLSHMQDKEANEVNIKEIVKLVRGIRNEFDKDKPQFIEPQYDYEMLSSYLVKSPGIFVSQWTTLLNKKTWQAIKAFNKRMCWKDDEFKDMKPVSDLHDVITKELEFFIKNPNSWSESATPSMQIKSLERVKQEFSKQLLTFSRMIILNKYNHNWEEANQLNQSINFSTKLRKNKIEYIINEVLPDHKRPEAIKMKDSIKNLLMDSINICKEIKPYSHIKPRLLFPNLKRS